MKTEMLQKWMPPGTDILRELKYIALGLAGASVYSLGFLFRYFSARSNLYYYEHLNGKQIRRLDTEAVITEFDVLTEGIFAGFGVLLLLLLLLGIGHYTYHYQGSKSMWLMKRIPDWTELHRRCLAIPLAAAVISILAAGLLFLIYYGVYVLCTPETCLPPGIL